MTHDQPSLADRLEIDDVLTRYSTLIDTRRFDQLDQVFTGDAVLDYRSAGGIRGSFPEVRDWLASVLPLFTWTQHLVTNRAVDLAPGAKSTARLVTRCWVQVNRGSTLASQSRTSGNDPRMPPAER